MVPYAAAAPDRAFVVPRRIELLVMPTSVCVVGEPGLAGHPLVRSDRQEEGEDRSQQWAWDRGKAAHHRAHEQLNRQRHWEGVGADEAGRQGKERSCRAAVERGDAESQRLVA